MSAGGWNPFNINPVDNVTAAVTVESTTENLVETSTVYTNASEVSNDWVTDAIITSTTALPAGTIITITDPAIGGSYELSNSETTLWLSDVIWQQNTSITTRTKLNGHTTQVFDFTVVLPNENSNITTDLTFDVVASDQVAEGTRQTSQTMTGYETLGTATLTGVTFTDGVS